MKELIDVFLHFQALIVEEPSAEPKENNPANLVSLKTQTSALRDQIHRLEKEEEFKSGRRGSNRSNRGASDEHRQSVFRGSERQRKKLAELEAQLLLASPSLVFQVRQDKTTKNMCGINRALSANDSVRF